MRHSNATIRNVIPWFPVLCLTAAIGAILVQSALTAGGAPVFGGAPVPQERSMRRGGPEASKIIVGEFPPDFDLPFLRLGEDEEGKPIGIVNDAERFRLSSFRGKRPVCMIMSSYT